jgi:hypothetical protein
MMPPLPAGSTISVGTNGADTVIVVPYRSAGPTRYGVGLFLLCWLGSWAYAWIEVSSKVLSGRANLFMIFWLCAWTVGGGFAAYALYQMMRQPIPEVFRLMTPGLRYDSGRRPFDVNTMNASPRPNWATYFPKRIQTDIDRQQLQSLRLRQTPTANRLTVDAGVTRLDLARDASEIEREWPC